MLQKKRTFPRRKYMTTWYKLANVAKKENIPADFFLKLMLRFQCHSITITVFEER